MIEGEGRVEAIPDALLRQIWDCSVDGMSLNDKEGLYHYVNPAYCAMVGYPAEQLIGQSFLKVVPAHYRAIYSTFYQSGALAHGTGEIGEYHIARRDGRVAITLVRHTMLRDPAGLHLFVVRDITEQKAIEEHLERAERMRTLGTLAGGVAHEFNNLLVSILGYAELIESSKESTVEALLDFARKIQRAARRGRELTAQLLPFTRPEARQKRSVDVNEVIRESAELFQISSPGVPLRLTFDAEPALVLGDAIQLHQVFLNLFFGAAAALSHPGQPIVLETRRVQESMSRGGKRLITPLDFVLIEISPHAVGDNPWTSLTPVGEQEQRLSSDPFDRTGLPMALVHGSVNSHGGWLAGEEGRLRIWLPALTRPEP